MSKELKEYLRYKIKQERELAEHFKKIYEQHLKELQKFEGWLDGLERQEELLKKLSKRGF